MVKDESRMKKNAIKISRSEKIFNGLNIAFMLIMIFMIYGDILTRSFKVEKYMD